MPQLVRPAIAHMASFIEAMREGYSRDTLVPETPETIAAIAEDPAWFLGLQLAPPTTLVLPDGTTGQRVPETILWYAQGDEFLGSVHLRHYLNDALAAWGGHIGYAVRPSAQGRGYATTMLAGMLDHCRGRGDLDRVMLTANTKNLASIRVIEKNGGVLADIIPHPWVQGDEGRRYWIALR